MWRFTVIIQSECWQKGETNRKCKKWVKMSLLLSYISSEMQLMKSKWPGLCLLLFFSVQWYKPVLTIVCIVQNPFLHEYLLWIAVYLYNFPEIKRPPSFQSGVWFHWHTSLERLPYAVGLQIGRGNHQQKHKTEEMELYIRWDSFFSVYKEAPRGDRSRSTIPHNERNNDVELDFPVGPRQALCTGGQHVVGQGGVQDKHELRAPAGYQFKLADDSWWTEVRGKPVGKGKISSRCPILPSH